MQDTSTHGPPPAEVPVIPGAKRRWLRFLAGLTAILLFAFGLVPALQQVGPVREVRDAIRNSGIDATALFYTDSEVFPEAEASIRDSLRFSARHTQHTAEPLP